MSKSMQALISQLKAQVEESAQNQQMIQLEAWLQLSQAIASTADLESLNKQIVKIIKNLFELHHVGIYLLDASGEWAVLHQAAGRASQTLTQNEHKLPVEGNSCVSWVYQNKKPYISYLFETIDQENGAFVVENNFVPRAKSELTLPLIPNKQVIGLLDLQSTEQQPFEDLTPFQTIAQQISPAIEKAQLYSQALIEKEQALQKLQKQAVSLDEIHSDLHETHLMLDVSRNLSGASSIQEVYSALNQSIATIGADHYTLYFCSQLDSNNVPTYAQIEFTSRKKGITDFRFPLAKYEALEELVFTQETLAIEDIETDERLSLKEQDFFRKLNAQSVIINPLVTRGHVIGLLSIEYQKRKTFSQRELALFRTLSSQTTIAIEQVRQIRITEDALTKTQTLYRAGRVLAEVEDFTQVLEDALIEFVYSFGLDQGGITLLTPDRKFGQLRAYVEGGQFQDVEKLRFPIRPNIVYQQLLLDGYPFTSYNVAEDERLTEFKSFNTKKPILSTLQAPMIARGETIGWIGVDATDEYKEFDQADIDLARAMADQIAIAIQNHWLLEQTERRAEQLKAVATVGEAVTGLTDLDEVLKSTVNLIRDTFNFYHVSIFLLDAQKEWAVVRASTGKVGKIMVEKPHRLQVGSNSIIGFVTDNAKPRIVLDVDEDMVHYKNPLLPDTRSEMGLPLISRGVVIGALDVQSVEPNAFTDDDVETLQIMTSQITAAIENARLFEQTQRRLTEQAMLYRIGTKIGGTLELQETTDILVRETAEALNVAESVLTLLEEEQTAYVISDYIRDNSLFKSHQGERHHIKEFVNWPKILKTKQELVIHINDTDISGWEYEYLKEHQGTALAIIPVLLRNDVIGLLEVYDDTPERRFTQEDISLLDSIALQAANAIENARLFAQTQQTLEQTQTLHQISHILSKAAEEQVTFEKVLAQYLQLLGLKQGSIMLFDEVTNTNMARARIINNKPVKPSLILPVEDDLVFQHLRDNPSPLVITNPKTNPLTKDHKKTRGQQQVVAMLFIPLTIRTDLLGSIVIDATEAGYIFNQADLEIGVSIADQLTIWLENRRLLTETQHRSERLQIAAEVSRSASSILDVDELINTSVNYIREQFGFYYVGLFLVDPAREWAVLQAGTGKAGRIQLENNHKLEIGGESMIGWCIENRKARIALDVGKEAVRFKNPILPDTRSEMALPLTSRGVVIGALTVQSTERGAFSQEDITMLQTMADQLANAIENANLFTQTQRALAEAETLYHITQQLSAARDEDTVFQLAVEAIGNTNVDSSAIYMYLDGKTVEHSQQIIEQKAVWTAEGSPAIPNGTRLRAADFAIEQLVPHIGWRLVDDIHDKTQTTERLRHILEDIGVTSLLVIPLSTHQQRLGFLLAAYKDEEKQFLQKEIQFFTTIAQQMVTTLENLRLLDASQKRAQREEIIREITLKIRNAVDVDDIMQTTVTELGKVLGTSRGNITLEAGMLAESSAENGSHQNEDAVTQHATD